MTVRGQQALAAAKATLQGIKPSMPMPESPRHLTG